MNKQEMLTIVYEALEKVEEFVYEEAYSNACNNIIKRENKRSENYDKGKKLYDMIDYKLIEKIIMASLPFRVRLLNKVTVNGKHLDQDGSIQYYYYFNNNSMKSFIYEPHISDLEKLIN